MQLKKKKKEIDNFLFYFLENIRREIITFVPTWSYYNPQTSLSPFTNCHVALSLSFMSSFNYLENIYIN